MDAAVTSSVRWCGKISELASQGSLEVLSMNSKRRGIANTGAPKVGDPIATSSGLVLIGAPGDKRFHAFDAKSGKGLWVTKLDATQPQRLSHIKAKMASSTWSWLREGRPMRAEAKSLRGIFPRSRSRFLCPSLVVLALGNIPEAV